MTEGAAGLTTTRPRPAGYAVGRSRLRLAPTPRYAAPYRPCRGETCLALAWHSLPGALQAFAHQGNARAAGVISQDGSRQPVRLHHQPLTLVLETSSHNEQG